MGKELSISRILWFILLFNSPTLFGSSSQSNSLKHVAYMKMANTLVRRALVDTTGYHFLRELTSIGPRLVGSENSMKAIQWAKEKMQSLGFDKVILQPVTVPRWIRGETESAEITFPKSWKGKTLSIASLGGSVGTLPMGIIAEVLEVNNFEELRSSEEKARGKIIFFNRPMDPGSIETFAAYGNAVNQRVSGASEAAKVGGVGAIVRSVTTKHDNVPHVGTLVYLQNIPRVPAVAIGLKDADWLSQALSRDAHIKIRLILSCHILPEVQSFNVIAELTGTEKPEEVIVIGGHIDSWDKGDGSHDDGAGCVQALEVLNLFQRLGIKPKRTIRTVFFINEEYGLSGAKVYGAYSETSNENHIAAIEADRGAFTPRGFYVSSNEDVLLKIQSWLPFLNMALIDWIRKGGSGADISHIKNADALIGFVPDVQRYFDVHHSDNDVFSEVHPREFELGAAAMAILTYLISEEGL